MNNRTKDTLLTWAKNGGENRGASRVRARHPDWSEGDCELVHRLMQDHDYTERGAIAYVRKGMVAEVFESEAGW